MAYPSLEQYNEALQLHSKLLTDPELRSGTVVTTGLGLPLAISGGFALTYTIKAGARKYAVRCFHRESKSLEQRYEAISRRIANLRSPYFVDFQFQPQGIKVKGTSYPIVKMAWAKGQTLGEFLDNNRSNAQALAKLSSSLETLATFFERERIAHGDIQTGNLMVSDGGANIQLIDYDGMYVDEIRSLGSSELGHVNFQHPGRKASNPFDSTLDRFSLISLWLALQAMRDDPAVWDKTRSEVDAIIFRANDFCDPASSAALALLSSRKALSADVKNFVAVCAASLGEIPSLADFIASRNVPSPVREIRFGGPRPASVSRPGYIGAYDVLSALDYAACLRRVGDKVEVIGKIVEVKADRTRNGKPYVFVNFGNWRGNIFKISIWNEGLGVIRSTPDASWVGKWISVVGLMEPPYVSDKYNYSHLAITVTAAGQMTVLAEADAQWRLAGPKAATAPSSGSNREALDKIKGRAPSMQSAATSGPVRPSNKDVLAKIRATTQPSRTGQPSAAQPQPRPTQRPAPGYPARPSQPQEKGIIEKIFNWLFG